MFLRTTATRFLLNPLATAAWLIAAAIAIHAGAEQQVPAAAGGGAERATLRIELGPYNDSAESMRQIEAVARALPPRQVTLPPGGSISRLLVDTYGFGPSNLPQTSSLLENRIMELNGIQSSTRIPAGPILVPSLPSNVRYNPEIAWNEFPATAEFRIKARGGIDLASASKDDVVTERIVDTTRRGANGMTFDLPLTAQILRDPSILKFARESFVTVPSEPLRVKLENQDCKDANPKPVLSLDQRKEIETLLKSAKRVVPVYIVDTGWPSAEALKESWDHFRSLLSTVRQRYHLGPSPLGAMPSFAEPSVGHCKSIERALTEFRSINSTQIKVVYVPMSKEQSSATLLSEMIEVADIARRVTSRFGRDNVPASIPPDILNDAKTLAAAVVRQRVPDKITGEVTETDKAVLESTIVLAAEGARLSDTFHVVNESWVVETDVVRYEQPSNPMGLIVAAAGNDGRNINKEEVDFAHRSSTAGGQFVAVMNVDANGVPICNSSTIDLSVLPTANAIGFPGAISGRSGTSYAAPRVAWLLAAAEALRPTAVEPGLWGSHVVTRLRNTRRPVPTASLQALFGDPLKLVRLWLD